MIDLARNQPKNPENKTPTMPPGVPKKCIIPNIIAEKIEIILSEKKPFKLTTTPNLVIISSTKEFITEKTRTYGKYFSQPLQLISYSLII